MTVKPTMDDITKGFLGDAKAQVVNGQTADAQKQADLYEQELMHEAMEYGNVLVSYVGQHMEETMPQRAFGIMLGVLNVRRNYPEGGQKFDDLVDLAGTDLETALPKKKEGVEGLPQAIQLTPDDLLKGGEFAEAFARYITMKKHQLGIIHAGAVYGIGRAFHTLRSKFPRDQGGSVAFDAYAKQAAEYFERYR